MAHQTFQFKTNINCGGCIKAVTPFLGKIAAIKEWHVDTEHPDKILTIDADGISEAEIMAVVSKAGYTIESLAS